MKINNPHITPEKFLDWYRSEDRNFNDKDWRQIMGDAGYFHWSINSLPNSRKIDWLRTLTSIQLLKLQNELKQSEAFK